jgi:hypothetical protein
MDKKTRFDAEQAERGSSLIEVLFALLIMLFLMIGVLQLFAMAYLVNLGSGARTEMTSKAEQVIENIRCLKRLDNLGITPPTSLGVVGITFPMQAETGTLDPTVDTYWGPSGANVFPTSGDNDTPFMISYAIVDADPFWRVTVTVLPTDVSGARGYIGAGISRKRVDYVAQMLK